MTTMATTAPAPSAPTPTGRTGSGLPTMHELWDTRAALDELLFENEGELTVDLEQAYDQLAGTEAEKLEKWALWILERDEDAEKLKKEIARLKLRRDQLVKAVERSRAGLLFHMQRLGRDKVNGLLCTVTVALNPEKVTGEATDADMETLRAEYPQFVRVKVVEEVSVDKKALLAAYKTGDALPPMFGVTRDHSLRIK